MKKIAFILLLLTLAAACVCSCSKNDTQGIPSEMHKMRQSKAYYKLPYITSGAQPKIIEKVNAEIMRIAEEAVGAVDKDAIECQVAYEVGCAQNELFSFAMFVYSYTGGAHGSTKIIPVSFDLKTGEQLVLEEQFDENRDWRKKLLEFVEDEINASKNYQDTLTVPESIPKSQAWSFTSEVLVLIYQEYEIGPYALGAPVFDIPLLEISGMLKLDSPLRRLTENAPFFRTHSAIDALAKAWVRDRAQS